MIAHQTLLAIEKWLIAGDSDRARTAYASVQQPPAASNVTLERTVRARILLLREEPEEAIELLQWASAQPMPTARRLVVERLRAETYIALEQPARSIEIMRQRESYLGDTSDLEASREQLWAMLDQSTTSRSRRGAGQ